MSLTRLRGGVQLAGQAPPRVRHCPRVRSNSWEDVADLMASVGAPLDEWQENVLEASLGERSDGKWAARQVGVSTPRQNGKSQLIVARALAGVLLFDEQLIMISAHQQDTAREVFTRLVDILEDNPSLNERVESYGKALNREYIRFKTGQTIRFKARSSGGGRGFSSDCLLLDEAQILSGPAWAAIIPTMSARPNPQVWLLGTPPTPLDDGEVFGRLRAAGIEGRDKRLTYVEWSAAPSDSFDDPAVWAKANPSYGTRIFDEAILSERTSMSDEQFAMERLGMWAGAVSRRVISSEAWTQASDPESVATERLSLAVDVSPELATTSIALAGQRSDGRWHVELGEQKAGTDWVASWVSKFLAANPKVRALVLDVGSPAAALVDDFAAAGIRYTTVTVKEVGVACDRFVEGVKTADVVHTGQVQLSTAVDVARKRSLGTTGMWAWNKKSPTADITALVACTMALWGAQTSSPVRQPGRNANGRRAVVL